MLKVQTENSFVLVTATALILFAAVPAHARKSCTSVYNPMYPGLKQCTVSVDPDTQVAKTPEPQPQKMPFWCWAASLSMIYTDAGHPISQESIVLQNYGSLVNVPGGDFIHFEQKLNRVYTDDNGNQFRSVATLVETPEDAADALDHDLPILYTTSHHATVQTKLIYQVAPGGPVVVKGGELWDPEPGVGRRHLSGPDVTDYSAAWSIEVDDK